jgi:glutamate-5-semialdehyde dehydrogenase
MTSLIAMGKAARKAATSLAAASDASKTAALMAMAKSIRTNTAAILKANAFDLAQANQKDLKASFVDRLTLTEQRLEAMAKALKTSLALPIPWAASLRNGPDPMAWKSPACLSR